VSKRSYRRLAVVAGAALAVGSMAPAMAAQIDVDGTTTVDVSSDVALPTVDAESLIQGAFLADAEGFVLDTVFGAQDLAGDSVAGLQTDVDAIVSSLVDATSDLSVDVKVIAGANAGPGGASATVSGLAVGTGDADLLGLIPEPGTALADVQDSLSPVVDFGLGTAFEAIALAGDAQVLATGTAGGLLGTGLGLVDGVSLSANVVAAVLASL
jgi:hypothetical protein